MAVLPGNPKLIIDALMKLFGGAGKQVDRRIPGSTFPDDFAGGMEPPLTRSTDPRTLSGGRANTDHPDFDPGEFYGGNLPERRNFGERSFDDTEGAARRGEVEEYADFPYGITNDPAGQAFDDFVNSSISKGQIDEVLLRQLELADPELVPVALERIQKFLGSRAGRQTITPESSPINSNTILDDDIPF